MSDNSQRGSATTILMRTAFGRTYLIEGIEVDGLKRDVKLILQGLIGEIARSQIEGEQRIKFWKVRGLPCPGPNGEELNMGAAVFWPYRVTRVQGPLCPGPKGDELNSGTGTAISLILGEVK
ncbi:hypothetical protein THAOC_35998 [Thalassiosira oceanica]|uniref:Uncharacterized protein n=1 Tax=Thalassiosira oceanica TaxID=159749 RepID=K0R030_THAOC|nr:hypothetical protein THAOC_35998 [Thalassiosira oceanica]|eukprot:EJK45388.1 hypothetical protein THAOC_35998 [Thalassiosira oceanica]